MPKRTDLQTILLIGSGPIVIGQACEFDYSGTQACKALREEGYRVVLVNSNPATIMTDPEFADRTYIEPMTAEVLEQIIASERPEAILPTLGGQTGLNLAIELAEAGVLEKLRRRADRRQARRRSRRPRTASSSRRRWRGSASTCRAAATRARSRRPRRSGARSGCRCIIRPSLTLGGTGGGIADDAGGVRGRSCEGGLAASPTHEVLIEESIAGWKEFELEVMRDGKDNVVIVCSIENFDPMGVHTGDSITVAPAQTLTDKEYQLMRDAAIRIIREIGVDTGGSNIQFAVDPETGRLVVIEMNPRVSRSSALASKATGFPIAKIAAKLAVGYTLDEIQNDITRETPACFEPTIDYVVIKIPRFAFEKFPATRDVLGAADEVGRRGDGDRPHVQGGAAEGDALARDRQRRLRADRLRRTRPSCGARLPRAERAAPVGDRATRSAPGSALEEIAAGDAHRPVVPAPHRRRSSTTRTSSGAAAARRDAARRRRRWASPTSASRRSPARPRTTCAPRARAPACTPSTSASTPAPPSSRRTRRTSTRPTRPRTRATSRQRKKIIILGGGPNRIGQGIEFDYCCVHAAFALKDDGFETIMVNCNPETVSTDYDTSDRLYFEPLTLEDVLAIVHREKPDGVIVQFGGQTPLKLAVPLARGRRADPRHQPRRDRPRRGPRALRRGAHQARAPAARQRHRALAGRGDRDRQPHRLPGAGAAALRARRPRDGDRLRAARPRALRAARVRGVARPARCSIDQFLEDAIEVDVDA